MRRMRSVNAVELTCRITCPQCHHESVETMPMDSCQFFYLCPHCQTLLRPKRGECCVFCSYGSVPCPPVQRESSCTEPCEP